MATLNVRELGDFIREQRRTAQISLRQLAKQAGVSNPYLSQIERGLRKPSAEILQQIAKALRISAEVLYVQAGILEEREGGEDVHAAVLADEFLTARQKQVVLDIYDAFRRENAIAGADGAADAFDIGLGGFGVVADRPVATTDGVADTAPSTPAAEEKPAGVTKTTAARAAARRPRAASAGEAATAQPARRAATRRTTAGRTTADGTGKVAETAGEPTAPADASGTAPPVAPQP